MVKRRAWRALCDAVAVGPFLRSRAGTAAIEFAIIFPLFAALAFGVMEFGRLFWIRHTVQYAAEEAGRHAITDKSATPVELEAYAKSAAAGLNPDGVMVTIASESSGGIDYVSIQTQYEFEFLTQLFGSDAIMIEGRSRVPVL